MPDAAVSTTPKNPWSRRCAATACDVSVWIGSTAQSLWARSN